MKMYNRDALGRTGSQSAIEDSVRWTGVAGRSLVTDPSPERIVSISFVSFWCRRRAHRLK